jgi:hypothetical protein
MVICADTTTEKWSPDFSSSGQANPSWTRVMFREKMLINSLEWMDWTDNPVQLLLCEACGTIQCEYGGYVHVSRLDDFVLLTAPQLDDENERVHDQFAPHFALEQFGAIAIPPSVWAQWRTQDAELPDAVTFAPANGRALAEAWSLGPGRPKRLEDLLKSLKHRLVACDSLDPESALRRVEHWLGHFSTNVPMASRVVAPSELGARIETLYFDGPGNEDWPALAITDERDYVALDREHVLVDTI